MPAMVVVGAEERLIDGPTGEVVCGSFITIEHVVERVLLGLEPKLIVGFDITVEAKYRGLACADDIVLVPFGNDGAGVILELASEEIVPGLVSTIDLARLWTDVCRVEVAATLVLQPL